MSLEVEVKAIKHDFNDLLSKDVKQGNEKELIVNMLKSILMGSMQTGDYDKALEALTEIKEEHETSYIEIKNNYPTIVKFLENQTA